MKIHTTNYFNTLILIAEDCPVHNGERPPEKGDKKSIANEQFDIISKSPYKYTSDEILFQVHSIRKDLTEAEVESAKADFFSKGQACLRSSPLGKRYGWGIHFDEKGKVALYGAETETYKKLFDDKNIAKVKAMRSKRA